MATPTLFTPSRPAGPLRLALRANAAFSSTCALLFLFEGSALAPLLGVPSALLAATGLGLLGFAAALVASSLRADPARLAREARLHCAADMAWVAGSVPVVALGLLSTVGGLALASVSAVVLVFAALQWRGIGRLAHTRV